MSTRKRIWLIAAAVLLFFVGRYSVSFSTTKLSATVTERNTGKPVQGALVVVIWKLERPMLHGHEHQVIHRVETITDENGHFEADTWGPKYAGLFWSRDSTSPYAYVLKSGYKFEIAWTLGDTWIPGDSPAVQCPPRRPEDVGSKGSWNGCAIRIAQPTETPGEYASRLAWIRDDLCGRSVTIPCSEPVSRYFDEERRRLLALGAKSIPWR